MVALICVSGGETLHPGLPDNFHGACFEAGRRPGELITKPLILSPDELQLNLATAAAGEALVEQQSSDGTPLPGFSLGECRPMIGHALSMPVIWEQNHDMRAQSSTPARIRVRLHEAKLFALQIKRIS